MAALPDLRSLRVPIAQNDVLGLVVLPTGLTYLHNVRAHTHLNTSTFPRNCAHRCQQYVAESSTFKCTCNATIAFPANVRLLNADKFCVNAAICWSFGFRFLSD